MVLPGFFPLIRNMGAQPLVFVGGRAATAGNGGNATITISSGLTGGIGTAAAADDLVVVFGGYKSTATRSEADITTTGYSKRYYGTGANNPAAVLGWKIMGGTPDTDVVGTGNGNAAYACAYVCHVWRNIYSVINDASKSWGSASHITTSANPKTWTGVSIGSDGINRMSVVGIKGDGGGGQPLSVTVDGQWAIKVAEQVDSSQYSSIWVAFGVTGTTADIVVTWSSAPSRQAYSVYSAYDVPILAPDDTDSSIANPPSMTALTVPDGGIGIAGVAGGSGGTYTWTGFTEDSDTYSHSMASLASASATTPTITSTPSAGTANALCGASWAKGAIPLDANPTVTVQNTASTNPNAPSITTVTNGAVVIDFALSIVNDSATTAPTGYSNKISANLTETTGPVTIAATSKLVSSAGAEDPAAYTVWSSGQWIAASVAIRPAA